jgi:hypothetical protein
MRQFWRLQERQSGIAEQAVALAVPEEGADGRELAGERAAFRARIAAAGQKAAKVRRGQSFEIGECGRRAQVILQEGGELPGIAAIGFKRLDRHAPLGFERGEPHTGGLSGIGGESEGESGHGARLRRNG